MYIPDQNSADLFSEYLDSRRRKWNTGHSYTELNDYTKEYPCYMFNEGLRCATNYATNNGYTILRFSDFDWEYLNPELPDEDIEIQNAFLAAFIK